MIRNYLLTALRNIRKQWLYVAINILGLALALAVCITAFYNNKWDWDFDKIHKNYKDIYKINVTREIQGRDQEHGICPMPLTERIQQDIPFVEEVVDYCRTWSPVKKGEKIFNKRIAYTSGNFTDVFTLDMIRGDIQALQDPNQILIGQELAGIYFGEENPIGQILSIFDDKGREHTFTVGGVYRDFPYNSSFSMDILTDVENYLDMWEEDPTDWKFWNNATFLLIRDPGRVDQVEEMLQGYIPVQNRAREDWKISSFRVEPLATIHRTIRDRWSTSLNYGLHPTALTAPPIMAIFILVIACFNFINTAIAFAGSRLKEIGVRKIYGGQRRQVIVQFLTENFLMALVAIVVGIYLSTFILSAYSQMWPYMELQLSFNNSPDLILFLLALLLATTLMAGAYPAFYISSFSAVRILRERLRLSDRNLLSKVLLTLQFIISMLALVSGVMFTQNAEFQKKAYLGYNKNNLMVLNLHNKADYKALEQVVQSTPGISSYAGTQYHIGYGNYRRTLNYLEQEQEVSWLNVGLNYLQTMGVTLREGRFFGPEFESSDLAENSIIVNEKLARDFKWDQATGKTVYQDDTLKMRVVGMVENFYMYGLWSKVEPLAMRLAKKEDYGRIAVQTREGSAGSVHEALQEGWKQVIPNYPFNGMFQEELMQESKDVNKNIKQIFTFLSIAALLLSAVGLYALVSLRVLSKTKEIGIRKVVGASIAKVMQVVGKPYSYILGISIVIGLVAGYYNAMLLMDSLWSEHTGASVEAFLIPVVIILLTAALTVTGKIYQASAQNPARSLRYE